MDKLLNTAEVAKRCGLAEVTLRKWRMTGDGPMFIRLGSNVRYRPADVDAYLAKHAFDNTSAAKEYMG